MTTLHTVVRQLLNDTRWRAAAAKETTELRRGATNAASRGTGAGGPSTPDTDHLHGQDNDDGDGNNRGQHGQQDDAVLRHCRGTDAGGDGRGIATGAGRRRCTYKMPLVILCNIYFMYFKLYFKLWVSK